MFDSSENI